MSDANHASVEHRSVGALEGTTRPFGDGEPDVVRLRLDAGESVAPHAHSGRQVVFFGLEGTFDVTIADRSWRVEAGDCLRFDGDDEVSPAATEEGDAAALIVLAKA